MFMRRASGVDHSSTCTEWSTTRSTGTSGSMIRGSCLRSLHGRAHRRQVHEQRHAGEVLEHDPRDDERDLRRPLGPRLPGGEGAHVVFLDPLPVAVAQERLEDHAEARRAAGRSVRGPPFRAAAGSRGCPTFPVGGENVWRARSKELIGLSYYAARAATLDKLGGSDGIPCPGLAGGRVLLRRPDSARSFRSCGRRSWSRCATPLLVAGGPRAALRGPPPPGPRALVGPVPHARRIRLVLRLDARARLPGARPAPPRARDRARF